MAKTLQLQLMLLEFSEICMIKGPYYTQSSLRSEKRVTAASVDAESIPEVWKEQL